MNDKFILKRKRKEYKQSMNYPKISVDHDVYQVLAEWAAEEGISLSEIMRQVVLFYWKLRESVEE